MFDNVKLSPEFDFAKSRIRSRMRDGKTLWEAVMCYRDIIANIIAQDIIHGTSTPRSIIREYEWLNWMCVWCIQGD